MEMTHVFQMFLSWSFRVVYQSSTNKLISSEQIVPMVLMLVDKIPKAFCLPSTTGLIIDN